MAEKGLRGVGEDVAVAVVRERRGLPARRVPAGREGRRQGEAVVALAAVTVITPPAAAARDHGVQRQAGDRVGRVAALIAAAMAAAMVAGVSPGAAW